MTDFVKTVLEHLEHALEEAGGWYDDLRGTSLAEDDEKIKAALQDLKRWREHGPDPIDMVLHCPMCHTQHIDAPEFNSARNDPHPSSTGEDDPALSWTNPPHRSHLCHTCGYVWRPADVATNGVKAIKTKGRHDSAIPEPATFSLVGIKDVPQETTEGWRRITPDSPPVGLKVEVQQYGRRSVFARRQAGPGHDGGFFDLATGLKMRPQPTRWRLPA